MLGTSELILILCVALLLFGGKRLPELAKSLGHALAEFKKAVNPDFYSPIEKHSQEKNPGESEQLSSPLDPKSESASGGKNDGGANSKH